MYTRNNEIWSFIDTRQNFMTTHEKGSQPLNICPAQVVYRFVSLDGKTTSGK